MAIFSVRSEDNDLTLAQAQEAAQRDYARLLHLHSPSWQFDPFARKIRYLCSCDNRARDSATYENHLIDAIKTARGPTRPPQKPK